MLFARNRLLRSAYDELVVVGSRWTQVLAVPANTAQVGPPHVQSHLAHPTITVIPMLHVASIKFYDRVLEYIDHAVRCNKDTLVLLEGICDSEAAGKQQMQEYQNIMRDKSLQQTMLAKADDNTLYSPEVMREICHELGVRYDILQSIEPTVRLQECYLKPKLAAMCGLNLRNHADLDMHEVQRLLEAESAKLYNDGVGLPSSIAVSQIGSFPVIRRHRERKVAHVARTQCTRWIEQETEGEVIIPWGYFHAEGIIHYILEGNKSSNGPPGAHGGVTASPADISDYSSAVLPMNAAHAKGTTVPVGLEANTAVSQNSAGVIAAAEPVPPRLLFVVADELIAKVPFDVPKELIESVPGSTDGNVRG